jgi:hypothetical protein
MLALMFDPMFKNMRLITMFMGHENATLVVVKYNEKLLLPLLMFNMVETTSNFHSKGDYEDLFYTSIIVDTHKDIVSRDLVGFVWVPIDVKVASVYYLGGAKKSTSF